MVENIGRYGRYEILTKNLIFLIFWDGERESTVKLLIDEEVKINI